MNSVSIATIFIPSLVSVLLFMVFTYLHEQSRQAYFRAWQLAWAAYTLHYVLDAFPASALASFVRSLLLVTMALLIFISTRLMRSAYRFRRVDAVVGVAGVALAGIDLWGHMIHGVFHPEAEPTIRLGIGLAAVLLYSSAVFYINGHKRGSLAFQILAVSLALWAALISVGQLQAQWVEAFGSASRLFGPVPQMLLGIAMVMVLFENERNAVQETTLALSTLGVDPKKLLPASDLVPTMQAALERLTGALPMQRAAICISERWRRLLPSVQRGFSQDFLQSLESTGTADYLCELTYRQSGIFTVNDLAETTEPLPAGPIGAFADLKRVLTQAGIRNLTAVSLQARQHNFGIILFPHVGRKAFGSSGPRLLVGLALQLGLTLENYVVTHEAHRRTKEYELMTQIGQAISSHLDQDDVLRTIQVELGQIFDTSQFYIAFKEGDEIQFQLEVRDGRVQAKRNRELRNAFTEYVIQSGEALLIRSELEKVRSKLGITYIPERPAKCLIAAPIFLGNKLGNKPAGAMVAMNPDREFAFEQRDLDVLVTAAGQVSVAVENARLFAEEQRRSKQLAFLNNISRTAISSDDPVHMLGQIVGEIQKNFSFDHIGIGLLDYGTKEIEIKAEAGVTARAMGRRIPLGTGILGRVARTGERALVQNAPQGQQQGILPESRSVLCIPITYGEMLLGVLNIESRSESAFVPQDVLILNTLADLLATALHNAFVFQKLQQQSITDGLTGIKTRRFFWEALSAEWKRASRSGRPFSVVLIDLDKFKEVNDNMGHFEGDLVLARVGRLLEQKSRQSNVVARYGGDEFIILMPETGPDQAQVLAERLRLWIEGDPMLSERKITGSFGVASFPMHGFSIEDVIRVADAGMYVSKRSGGNRVSTADEFAEGEGFARQRQQISAYIEGFLQRERTGPEHLEELTATLRKLCGEDDSNVGLLQESIESLSRAAESRELHTAGHGDMVARYAEIIARALGMPADEVTDLVYAARVHDVGKIFVPEHILNKPGPLSDEEFAQVRSHPAVGAEIVATIPGGARMREAIEHHHQRFDGTGYPGGLRGEQIPLWARIIAVTDAYANMLTEQSVSAARTPDQALDALEKMSGTGFDGMLVRLFLSEMKAERASFPGNF
jgi:diguanylate cyclase (GGDEF)-like protein